jgi:citrate synthase
VGSLTVPDIWDVAWAHAALVKHRKQRVVIADLTLIVLILIPKEVPLMLRPQDANAPVVEKCYHRVSRSPIELRWRNRNKVRKTNHLSDNEIFMEPWRTALATSDAKNIWIRGYDIASLMRRATFVDTIFLLHRGRLPDKNERRLLDAILIAVADHGAGAPSCATARLVASGNRQSLSAAIAAGILAIGDEHGGAGSLCMEMIDAGVQRAQANKVSLKEAAEQVVAEAKIKKTRLPGFGHRVHSEDPRKDVLFHMARECSLAKDGVAFMDLLEVAVQEKIKPLPINVDGALAAVLYDLGFPPAAGKLFFIIGRVAGLTAEVAEEYAREKAMRIRIPVEYDGEPPRELP